MGLQRQAVIRTLTLHTTPPFLNGEVGGGGNIPLCIFFHFLDSFPSVFFLRFCVFAFPSVFFFAFLSFCFCVVSVLFRFWLFFCVFVACCWCFFIVLYFILLYCLVCLFSCVFIIVFVFSRIFGVYKSILMNMILGGFCKVLIIRDRCYMYVLWRNICVCKRTDK